MTVIDTNSRCLIRTFLKTRDETPDHIDNILKHITKSKMHTPRVVHTDNAKEYLSCTSQYIYNDNNVTHTTTVPYSPQENGIAEIVNRTILNAARSALHHVGLPNEYWEDAVKDAAFK